MPGHVGLPKRVRFPRILQSGETAVPKRTGATGVRWPRECPFVPCTAILRSRAERDAHLRTHFILAETHPNGPKPPAQDHAERRSLLA